MHMHTPAPHVNYFAINVKYLDEGKNFSTKFLTQLEEDMLQDYGLQKDHVL